jgi:LCP family protein required for cell wall assembly
MLDVLMPPPNEPVRGIIIPFPAAAIRKPPTPAFVTRPAFRVPPRGRMALAWFAVGSLVTALLAAFLVAGAASRAARRQGGRSGAVSGLRTTVPGSVNLLIAGLDAEDGTRADAPSDVVALLHLDATREQAWLVSIPRDARVTLPGHGDRRIEAAYELGGPALLVATFERLSRLPVDHVAVIDRTGLRRLTDGVGGVALELDPPAGSDARHGSLALEVNGAMAVDYVSELERSPAGDLDHIRREHRYLRALFAQLDQRGTLGDPPAFRDLATSLGGSMRVDAALAPDVLRTLLESTQHLRAGDVTLLTAPVVLSGLPSGPAIVRPEASGCAQLWDALAHDEMPAFVAAHPELVTPQPEP